MKTPLTGIDEALEMLRQMMGFIPARALYVIAKLEIADHLSSGPKTAMELASETGVDANALYRVMRQDAGLGALAEDDGRRFALTK